jgi:hypothetical protein
MRRRLWKLVVLLPLSAAVAVAVAVAADLPGGSGAAPEATASAVGGSFTQSNSRDGMPVLASGAIGPGDSVAGSVTIANTGTLGGAFSLSARDVADVPGFGGGTLSEALTVDVRDLALPDPVYSGPLTGLDGVPVGYLDPGEARDYSLAATLPHSSGDDAYAGGSTGFRLVWDGVETDAPPMDEPGQPGDGGGPGGDGGPGGPPGGNGGNSGPPPASPPNGRPAPPLRVRVRVPRVQRVLGRKRVLVRVRCNRPCRLAARGTIRIGGRQARLRTWRTRLARGGVARPRVRIPRGLRAPARRALARHLPVVFHVAFSGRDRAGRRVVVRRKLVVRGLRDSHRARVVSRPRGGVR